MWTNAHDLVIQLIRIEMNTAAKLMTRYRHHFADPEFVFPRQKVNKIKLFKNIPILGVFTGKTLKQNINRCNQEMLRS